MTMFDLLGRYEKRFRFSECWSGIRESEEDSLKSSIWAPKISFFNSEL